MNQTAERDEAGQAGSSWREQVQVLAAEDPSQAVRRGALVALAAVSAWLAAAVGFAADYTVDAAHSTVGFSVRHLAGRTKGVFRDFSGSFSFDPKKPDSVKGSFTAKAVSIDTGNAKRDDHLRSADFFDSEKHPTLTLAPVSVKAAGPGKYLLVADVTLRGITKRVPFDLEHLGSEKSPWGQTADGFAAKGVLNRKDFGLGWNKVLESGSLLVGEDVTLEFELEAIRK